MNFDHLNKLAEDANNYKVGYELLYSICKEIVTELSEGILRDRLEHALAECEEFLE